MTIDTSLVNEEKKPNDKEYNFRALEAKYQRQLETERAEREKITRELEEARGTSMTQDAADDEPYIDKSKLQRELAKFGAESKKNTKQEIQQTVAQALAEERQNMWLKGNPDYYDVMQHANKIAEKDPELAETILAMPDTFERKKLVYRSIKTMELDKPPPKQSSTQEKIDANRKNPFYQASSVSNAPYAATADFSPVGQKQAYEKMQELKARMRLG